ncbi:hypothetical protein ES703_71987 [subsurface metagenome]
MVNFTNRPVSTDEFPGYPTYAEALSYAENFRRGARSAYRKLKNYAAFRHSTSLKVAVRRLYRRVYEVRAYPFYNGNNPLFENQRNSAHYRAWLLTYDSNHRRWACFLNTQVVSESRYRRFKRRIGRPHANNTLSLHLMELTRDSLPVQPIYSKQGHLITR